MNLDDFRAFYEAHFPFAWRVLRRLGARDDELPDLLQEVFLVAHRKLPEFEGRARVTTWLFSICHNVFRASRRRRREQPLPDQADDATSVAPQREELLSARKLLLGLPEEQRIVFLLFELEGLSGDEIAEALSIPVGTVRSRLRLARESFRNALDQATVKIEGVGYHNV
jgi:RNA polymerase sigma-70 factor, ECF subfamily